MATVRTKFLGKNYTLEPTHKNKRTAFKFHAELNKWFKANEHFNKIFKQNAISEDDEKVKKVEIDEVEYSNHLMKRDDLPYQFLIEILNLNADEITKLDNTKDDDIGNKAIEIRNGLLDLITIDETEESDDPLEQ